MNATHNPNDFFTFARIDADSTTTYTLRHLLIFALPLGARIEQISREVPPNEVLDDPRVLENCALLGRYLLPYAEESDPDRGRMAEFLTAFIADYAAMVRGFSEIEEEFRAALKSRPEM